MGWAPRAEPPGKGSMAVDRAMECRNWGEEGSGQMGTTRYRRSVLGQFSMQRQAGRESGETEGCGNEPVQFGERLWSGAWRSAERMRV